MPRLDFVPSRHGWHFGNHFRTHVLPGVLSVHTSGLCGGMIMTALDYWRSNTPIPTHRAEDFRAAGSPEEQLPAEGSHLRTYIFDRQMNSLLTAAVFTRWIVFPWFGPKQFHDWAIDSELDVVRRQIDRGRPAMLGLWSMTPGHALGGHQVLAYGYELSPARLYVYDPNHPDREMLLVPVSPERGCEMRDAATGEVRGVYRGYFWTDVYNWNEPPYVPRYHDLELTSGLTLTPANEAAVGARVQSFVTVRNAGEYPAGFQNLYIWTRGPRGENLDPLMGGSEAIQRLEPDQEHSIVRTCASFGTQPGPHVVGISYRSRENDWININVGPRTTSAQRQLFLRAGGSERIVDRTVEVRESDADVDTGVDIAPGMDYSLTASGSIWSGVWFTGQNGPAGWQDRTESDPRFPLHGQATAHPFALIGRFDGGPYFYVGNGIARTPYAMSGTRRLWLRVNDDVPNNGSGSFRCRIQVWR